MKKISTALYLFFLLTTAGFAQVNTSVSIIRPTPALIAEWRSRPEIVQVILSNISTQDFFNARLSITIRDESRNVIAETDDFHTDIPYFNLMRGATIIRRGPEIVRERSIRFLNRSMEDRVRSTGMLPEGTYEFCVRVLDENRNSIGSTGEVCAIISILVPDPPRLIYPVGITDIDPITYPQFTWTPLTPQPTGISVRYRIKIVAMYEGQSGRYAMDHNPDADVLLNRILPPGALNYQYQISDRRFEDFLTRTAPRVIGFAWQVQSLDDRNNPIAVRGDNDGRSEIGTFNFRSSSSSSSTPTLEAYYPRNNDTLPWLPPHLIVQWAPYNDNYREMDYTLTVEGGGDRFTNSRVLNWGSGPRISQGVPTNERAQLIIVNQRDASGNTPSWLSSLRRGVRYSWNVTARFRRADGSIQTVSSAPATFTMGFKNPLVIAPLQASNIDGDASVQLQWRVPRPDMLNYTPADLTTVDRSTPEFTFFAARERMRIEVSRNADMSIPFLRRTLNILPTSGQYVTGDNADEFFADQSFSAGQLPEGTYYWRVRYVNPADTSVSYNNPLVWSFFVAGGSTPVSTAECLRIMPASPEHRGQWTSTNKPRFSVIVSPLIRQTEIRGGRLRVWRLTSPTADTTEAMRGTAVFDRSFTGSAESVFQARTAGAASRPFDLTFVNETGSAETFTATDGETYIWKFTLRYRGNAIRQDGQICLKDSSESSAGIFTYRNEDVARTTSGACRDDCSPVTIPTTRRVPASRSFSIGDSIYIGRFGIALATVSGTGSNLSGTGTIAIPFLNNARINVEFSNIQVNEQREIYGGEISAQTSTDSPISSSLANQLTGTIGLSDAQISSLQTYVSQTSRLVSGLAGATNLSLPIGFDNTIDGERMVVGVIGMVFRPTGAYLNAAMSFPLPFLGPGIGLGLGARNICFHPRGIGGDGKGLLYLASDIGYRQDSSWSFAFKSPQMDGTRMTDSGTYISWDCNGFLELRVKADVEFPRTWLVPAPDNGALAKAQFATVIRRGGDWLASATMGRFSPSGAPDFVMEASDIVFDFSEVRNPEGIAFPTGFVGETGNRWKGFFIRRAAVQLPQQFKTFDDPTRAVQFSVNNLLIGRGGLTASFRAENIISYPRGNFGEWGASIDTIAVDFVSSSLRSGRLIGNFKIPITDSSLLYSAIIARPPSSTGMEFEFNIRPRDTINAPLWVGRIQLNPTSRIGLTASGSGFNAFATLSGMLSISGSVGGISGLGFRGIGFENFRLTTASPYIQTGTWRFASEQRSAAGFPVSIGGIGITAGTGGGRPAVGLRFTLTVNLQPGSNAFSGGTTLSFWGKLASGSGGQNFVFDGVDLDSVGVLGQLGSAARIEGYVKFYREDPTYGTGFRGAVRANFLQQVEVSATVQFGSKNSYRYWYADARAIIASGIPVFTGAAIYGFGGGAWYHMRRDAAVSPPPLTAGTTSSSTDTSTRPDRTNSGFRFVPDDGQEFGFRAMVILGTHPSSDAFNADVGFEATFLPAGGVGRVSIIGAGYMMASVTNRAAARVTANVDLTYDFPAQTFHGLFDFWINASPLTGNGRVEMHVDPRTWYVKVGEPVRRVNINVANWLQVTAYLMVGQGLPSPPPLPTEVTNVLGPLPVTRNPMLETGDGFAFGASADINTGRQQFLIFYARLRALFGFDLALLNFGPRARCEGGTGTMGVNGWYAMGQLYAYVNGSIGLYVDLWFTSGEFEILGIEAAAALQGGAPNPAWIVGAVGGSYSILGGAVSGNCRFEFKMGTECRPVIESGLARVDIISDMQPPNGATNVSVGVEPQVAYNFTMERAFDLEQIRGDGSTYIRTFRVKVREHALFRADNNARVDATSVFSPDKTQATLTSRDMLTPRTQFLHRAQAYGEEYTKGSWGAALKSDGSRIEQIREQYFTTGNAPNNIPTENIAASYPYNRQKFFLQGECRTGNIKLAQGQDYLFEGDAARNSTYHARFVPLAGGTPIESPARYSSYSNIITYDIPTLQNTTVYGLQIIRRIASFRPKDLFAGTSELLRKISYSRNSSTVNVQERRITGFDIGGRVSSNERLLMVYYFKTSQHNRLQEKLTALRNNETKYSSLWGFDMADAKFSGAELFDVADLQGLTVTRSGGREFTQPALVKFAADVRNDAWHTNYTNPSIYEPIRRLRAMRFYPYLFDEFYRRNISSAPLAEVKTRPISLLGDSEVGRSGASSSSSTNRGISGFNSGSGFGGWGSSSFLPEPFITISHMHGMAIPIDHSRMRSRIAALLACCSNSEFMSAQEYNYWRRALNAPYQTMARGQYSFYSWYTYCIEPDAGPTRFPLRFTY